GCGGGGGRGGQTGGALSSSREGAVARIRPGKRRFPRRTPFRDRGTARPCSLDHERPPVGLEPHVLPARCEAYRAPIARNPFALAQLRPWRSCPGGATSSWLRCVPGGAVEPLIGAREAVQAEGEGGIAEG